MSLNMKTLTQALAKTAAVIEKTVTTTVQEVTGPRPLQDYDLLHQVGSGGPGLAWRLYSARLRPSAPATPYPLVCVWILDKKALSEARVRAGLSKAAEDGFFDIVRADAGRLLRIRHPGVVHVVQALDESKNAMAMVTEPLFASVANTLGDLENFGKVPKELKGMTVFITSSGAWKLGGFGFAISADRASSGSTSPFHYPYMNTLTYLTSDAFLMIPLELVGDLQRMLSVDQTSRPNALDFTESQDKNEFEVSTLPALVPVLSSASDDTLLLLVKHAELIINKASREHLIAHVLPMLVQAYDDPDARMQEEVLRRTVSLARQLDSQLVKQAILPRVHSLALRTTVAAVRVNALRCLGD